MSQVILSLGWPDGLTLVRGQLHSHGLYMVVPNKLNNSIYAHFKRTKLAAQGPLFTTFRSAVIFNVRVDLRAHQPAPPESDVLKVELLSIRPLRER